MRIHVTCFLLLHATFAMAAGNLVDGPDADLIYHPLNGNVTLDASDTASGKILSFVVGTDQNSMRPENFVNPFIEIGICEECITTFQIGQTDPLNEGVGPLVDLGDIFPPGFSTPLELSDYLTRAEYASELGAGGTFDLLVAPERLCGDFDLDGDVDSVDRTILTQNWTGALMEGGTATFAQGDCDGDGDIDTLDVTRLVQNWTGATYEDVCGDFDRDGDADTADLTIQTANWTGSLPPGTGGKTFADGDCDGDGDVDGDDSPFAPCHAQICPPPPDVPRGAVYGSLAEMAGNLVDGDDADLVYDSVTGNLTLDATDTATSHLIGFVLGTPQNDLRTENFTPPFIDVGTNTDVTAFQIGQLDPLNQGAGPLVDLGNIFPPFIASVEELSDYLSLAEYASDLGVGGTFDLRVNRVCGDFDSDWDVDSADRTQLVRMWTGAAPPGTFNKTFEEGDGDGDVDSADSTRAIQNWTGARMAGNVEDGGDADLIYNPTTGNVTIDASDTASGKFISFVFRNDDNSFRDENYLRTDGGCGPFVDVGENDCDASPVQIGDTDPLNQGADPLIDLGDIFPPGMSSFAELESYLTLAEYSSELGRGGTFDLMVVPEPNGILLTMLWILTFLARRRTMRD